jgi:hypothetical protein
MLSLNDYFVLCCSRIHKKIMLPTKACYLIKCCWGMEKTKLARELGDKKAGHKMTIGTDFDQFCAAREFLFLGLIKCCSRKYQIKNAVLEFRNN